MVRHQQTDEPAEPDQEHEQVDAFAFISI